jgi:hypothetical protein
MLVRFTNNAVKIIGPIENGSTKKGRMIPRLCLDGPTCRGAVHSRAAHAQAQLN